MTAERIKKTNLPRHPATRIILTAAGLLLGASFLVNWLGTGNTATVIPADFQLLATVDLLRQTWQDEPVAAFSLNESATVRLYFSLRDVNATYLDLSLSGPDGFRALILHSEQYRTDDNETGWEREYDLQPGDYQVVLTAQQNPGTLKVYWNHE